MSVQTKWRSQLSSISTDLLYETERGWVWRFFYFKKCPCTSISGGCLLTSVLVANWCMYACNCMYMPCCSPLGGSRNREGFWWWHRFWNDFDPHSALVTSPWNRNHGYQWLPWLPEPKRGRVASVRAGFSLLEVTSNSWSGTSSMGTWHCKENGGCVPRHFSDFPISWKP